MITALMILLAAFEVARRPMLLTFTVVGGTAVSYVMLRQARKITKEAEATALQAQLNNAEGQKVAADQMKLRQEMESQLGSTQTALKSAQLALTVIEGGALPLDRDAIVSAVQIAVSRLLGVVEGMDDQQRAQRLLDVCEHLRTLCGELEDDEAVGLAVMSKMAAINDQISGHVDRVINEAVQRLREAGIEGAKVYPGDWVKP